MRIIILYLFSLLIIVAPVLAQAPSKREMQEQMLQVEKDLKKQIAELVNQIETTRTENPGDVKYLEEQLVQLRKHLATIEAANRRVPGMPDKVFKQATEDKMVTPKTDVTKIKKTLPGTAEPVTIDRQLPKTDSVKQARNDFDYRSVDICAQKIKKEIIPPRDPVVTPPPVPRIKSDGELEEISSIRQELVSVTEKMWSPGTTITVGFYPNPGKAREIDTVKFYARKWELIANVKFRFDDDVSKTMVKIGFDDSTNTSFSWVGRELLTNPLGLMTMRFGMRGLVDTTFRRKILHEFGHTLGFVHEHQSPASGIFWDVVNVYGLFTGPQANWTYQEVDEEVFNRYSKTNTNFSSYDRSSIMHYWYPPELTVDRTSFTINTRFSPVDSAFARLVYPFPPTPANSTGILHTTDDCDEIYFSVVYNAPGVADYEVDFILEPGIDHKNRLVTWWKRIGIPLKGGGEALLEIQDGSISNRKFPLSIIDRMRGISFSKAKFLGILTPLKYKWNVLPAIIGGCRVKLTWRRDTCL